MKARVQEEYRGTSLKRKRHPLGPFIRHMRGALWRSKGGAVSYERGTPVWLGPLCFARERPRVCTPAEALSEQDLPESGPRAAGRNTELLSGVRTSTKSRVLRGSSSGRFVGYHDLPRRATNI